VSASAASAVAAGGGTTALSKELLRRRAFSAVAPAVVGAVGAGGVFCEDLRGDLRAEESGGRALPFHQAPWWFNWQHLQYVRGTSKWENLSGFRNESTAVIAAV
jgi:hypothetical protein